MRWFALGPAVWHRNMRWCALGPVVWPPVVSSPVNFGDSACVAAAGRRASSSHRPGAFSSLPSAPSSALASLPQMLSVSPTRRSSGCPWRATRCVCLPGICCLMPVSSPVPRLHQMLISSRWTSCQPWHPPCGIVTHRLDVPAAPESAPRERAMLTWRRCGFGGSSWCW